MTKTAKERIEEEHNFPKYNLDADFWRNRWVESSAEALQQQLKLIKLEKKLAKATEALQSIKHRTERDELDKYYLERNQDIQNDAVKVLAEIGGEDD